MKCLKMAKPFSHVILHRCALRSWLSHNVLNIMRGTERTARIREISKMSSNNARVGMMAATPAWLEMARLGGARRCIALR